MSDYVVSDTNLAAVADAIRAKGGTQAQLEFPADFVSAIAAIPTGGGASTHVTGTFKGTTTGAAMEVDVPYEGSGYPIAVLIYPKEGLWNTSGTFYSTVQRYAINTFLMVKENANVAPDYNGGSNDKVLVMRTYKNSSSNAVATSNNVDVYGDLGYTSATNKVASSSYSSTSNHVLIKSRTKLSVFIAGTSYGFMANMDYRYHVIYSS